jgi:hypothetical protein
MFIDDDKIQSIKHCELSSVVITVHGICLLGGCINNLDCHVGVIPMLVFFVCGYTQLSKQCFIVCILSTTINILIHWFY